MTTRKRHTRRQKENTEEGQTTVGMFVKFPHDIDEQTPVNKNAKNSDIEIKSTRSKKKAILQECTVTPNNDWKNEVIKLAKRVGRATRSKKNFDIESAKVEQDKSNELEIANGEVEKKSKRSQKRKATDVHSDSDSNTEEIKRTKKKENPSCESVLECEKTKPKKSKKNKYNKGNAEVTAHFIPETAGSQDKTQSPSELLSFHSVNTTAESFHSAAGSPKSSDITLIPETLDKSEQTANTLDTTFDKKDKVIDTTFEKVTLDSTVTVDETSATKKTSKKNVLKKSVSLDKSCSEQKSSTPIDKKTLIKSMSTDNVSVQSDSVLNSTYDKSTGRRSTRISLQNDKGKISEDIFETSIVLVDSSLDCTRNASKQSIDIYINKSNSSCDGKTPGKILQASGNIMNSTKESITINETFNKSTADVGNSTTKLKTTPKLTREGTFTRETVKPSEVNPSVNGSTESIKTPTKLKMSLSAPESTPYHCNGKTTRSNSILNLTHSIDKDQSKLRRSSLGAPLRQTRVMFCSPVYTPAQATERKKIIKSSMKGSNKSFVYEDNSPPSRPSPRKRSYTQNDAEDVKAKRKKLCGDDLTSSVNRLSRPKLSIAQAGPLSNTPKMATTLHQSSSEQISTSVRSKLPDFAALHRKQFDKMESLDVCQRRKAARAKQMLFPTSGAFTIEGRRSLKVTAPESKIIRGKKSIVEPKAAVNNKKEPKSFEPTKLSGTYTRFGFKLPTDLNPFSIQNTNIAQPKFTAKINSTISHLPKANGGLPNTKITNRTKEVTKLNGMIPALRREKSKQLLMREKSSTTILANRKKENRDIIKGVRTNRRFELQMKSRNCV